MTFLFKKLVVSSDNPNYEALVTSFIHELCVYPEIVVKSIYTNFYKQQSRRIKIKSVVTNFFVE